MIGMVETGVERNGGLAREISPRRRSTPEPSPPPSAPIGASRTGCTGFSTSSFTTTLPGCAAAPGRKTMAIVKHMAMNLVRNPKDRHSLKVRRKLANLNPDHLETLIRQTSALT
jgi:hypothetical protein